MYKKVSKELNFVDREKQVLDFASKTEKGVDLIYLKNKRKCASKEFKKNPIHIVEPNQSLFDIAQLYGIRLESLCKLNEWDEPHAVQVGEILRIR